MRRKLGCRDIGIKNSDFVAKIQFLKAQIAEFLKNYAKSVCSLIQISTTKNSFLSQYDKGFLSIHNVTLKTSVSE